MLVFLDFEASSLGKQGYPIEVGWVREDGASEVYLIRPAPGWDDWDPRAEAIHGIARATLLTDGAAHGEVAGRMVAALTDHDLLASAPSWDGKWLSALLRAAGLPHHALRLRDTEDAQRETAAAILNPVLPPDALAGAIDAVIAEVAASERGTVPAHRALADAQGEFRHWLAVGAAARAAAAAVRSDGPARSAS